jgi:Domain of unknown function (DUF4283)
MDRYIIPTDKDRDLRYTLIYPIYWGEEMEREKEIVITYLSSAADRDINRFRRYLTHRYGTRTGDLTSIRLTGGDFLINILKELSPRNIVNDSYDLTPRQGIMVDKFEGEPERRRPMTFRVTVHLNNIPLKLWSSEMITRILKDFGELTFIDDATTVGPDRRAIYAMVNCHDGWMIPLGTSARRGHLGKSLRDSGGLGKYRWPSGVSR